MQYDEFARLLRAQLEARFADRGELKYHEVLKNNGIRLDAVSICEGDDGILPTIYLNDSYKEYLDGMPIVEIVDHIVERYGYSREKVSFDVSFFTDFDKARTKLACKLVNYEKNRELLQDVPHVRFLDLAAVAICYFADDAYGVGTILVREEHLPAWRVTKEELFACARENTPRILPPRLMTLEESIGGYFSHNSGEAVDTSPLCVITNQDKYFGAGCLLYDSVLQEIGEKVQEDYWVLPSSVHECLILPMGFPATRDQIARMVREVNRTGVAREDFLSDEVYRYERDVHKLSL